MPATSAEPDADAPGALLQPGGALRAALLDVALFRERQQRADRLLEADGAGHLVQALPVCAYAAVPVPVVHTLPARADGRVASIESRPWRVVPIPVVLDAGTFRMLSRIVAE